MTVAEFFRKDGDITGFRVKGHSGFGEEGDDIVCASVSSAVMLTANLITDFFNERAEVSAEGDVFLLKAHDPRNESVRRLMKGLVTHLTMISEDYGKKYLKIKLTEV